jgi:hypothetical protein
MRKSSFALVAGALVATLSIGCSGVARPGFILDDEAEASADPMSLMPDAGTDACVFVYGPWDTTCNADSGPAALQGADLLTRTVQVVLPDGGSIDYHSGAPLTPVEQITTGCSMTPVVFRCCSANCCMAWAAYAPEGCP